MIVSDSKKFLFVHVPKTAGKSITAALLPHGNRKVVHPLFIHETITEFYIRRRYEGIQSRIPLLSKGKLERSRTHDASRQYLDYFKFAVVRNPWDRAVSMYSFLRKMQLYGIDLEWSFEAFVDALSAGDHVFVSSHTPRPQIDFICDYRGEIAVDRLCRFETLQDDFSAVCAELGVAAALPKKNTSDHKPYQDYYTPATRSKVGELYRRDVEAFGYAFE